MDKRWGIIGGVVLVIALLSPFFMGSSKKVQQLYDEGNALFTQRKYLDAIDRYNTAIKESKKPGARSEVIDKDFPALANYKIALCYDKIGETNLDIKSYSKAISQIEKTLDETNEYKHRENLYYLWARILFKMESNVQAELKFSFFINHFPNSTMVQEALYYDGLINRKLSRYNDSQVSFQRILDKFPASKYRADAEYYIAQLLVEKNIDPDNYNEKPEDQKMYETAVDRLEKNDVYEGYQLLLAVIQKHPESLLISNAYEKIGDIYYNAENYVNARQYYEYAMKSTADMKRRDSLNDKYYQTLLIPDTSEKTRKNQLISKYFIKPTIYRENGNYYEAAKLYETLSKIQDSSIVDISRDDINNALYWGGYCYYKAANEKDNVSFYEKSTELFNLLIDEFSDSSGYIKSYYYLALAYWEWGNKVINDNSKYTSVIDTVNEFEKRRDKKTYTDDQMWYSQLQELKWKAEKKINPYPVSTPNPKLDRPEKKLVERCRKLIINGDLTKATEIAKEALNITSEYQPAKQLLLVIRDKYYEQGWTLLDENLYDYAIVEFEKCIDLDPNFEKAYCNLGVIYIIRENYLSAINILMQAIDINSNFKEAHFNIGLAYLRLGEYDKAKSSAITALAIDPNYEAAKVLRNIIED